MGDVFVVNKAAVTNKLFASLAKQSLAQIVFLTILFLFQLIKGVISEKEYVLDWVVSFFDELDTA